MNLETPHGLTTAFAAKPDGTEPTSAVILIHEWWGINDHIRDLVGRYAAEGYTCVAPDLFRGQVANDATEAASLMNALALDDGIATIKATVTELSDKSGIKKIGITGYCMGGTFALRAACEIETLSAAAPFYGDIPDEDALASLSVPTLFVAAARDGWITPEKVEGLKDAARKFDLPVEIVSYDADHAFFNDTRPQVYDPEASSDAWRRVLEFFRERLTPSRLR
jgi:carboxymethylenebutenolidase